MAGKHSELDLSTLAFWKPHLKDVLLTEIITMSVT
jgi:hypothetical protein